MAQQKLTKMDITFKEATLPSYGKLIAEVITLDNTVGNNFTKHLLEGQSLKLVIPQYHTPTQTFNAGGGVGNIRAEEDNAYVIP